MEWLKKINNAIDYIENNLDSEISYDEAAQIACCSTYYFQRMFTYITGISLAEYIRRRRMTQAAFELQRTDKRVLEVGTHPLHLLIGHFKMYMAFLRLRPKILEVH